MGKRLMASSRARVVEEALAAALAPEPAFLVAPEGRRRVETVEGVGPDDAGLELRRHPQDPGPLVGPDPGAQPVGRVVGLLDRLVDRAESEDGEHGPEDFLPGDAVALRDPGEEGRREIVSLLGKDAGRLV